MSNQKFFNGLKGEIIEEIVTFADAQRAKRGK